MSQCNMKVKVFVYHLIGVLTSGPCHDDMSLSTVQEEGQVWEELPQVQRSVIT